MYKQSLAALFVMATLAGCASTKVQNPVNSSPSATNRWSGCREGMSQQEVLRIGGTPSGTRSA